jgi:hypothetical protein
MAASVSNPKMNTTLNGYFVGCSVWPVYLPMSGKRRQIGFEVELVGSHSPDSHRLDRGCRACNRVRLKLLASSISDLNRDSCRGGQHKPSNRRLTWLNLRQ